MRNHLQALCARTCSGSWPVGGRERRVSSGRGQNKPSTILPLLSRSRSTLHAFARHGRYGATRLQSTAPGCTRQHRLRHRHRTGGVLVAALHVLEYDMYSVLCILCSRGQDDRVTGRQDDRKGRITRRDCSYSGDILVFCHFPRPGARTWRVEKLRRSLH